MPVNEIHENFTTQQSDLSSFEYESVDDLNRLPFSNAPNADYIADFDDSVDFGVTKATKKPKGMKLQNYFNPLKMLIFAVQPWRLSSFKTHSMMTLQNFK